MNIEAAAEVDSERASDFVDIPVSGGIRANVHDCCGNAAVNRLREAEQPTRCRSAGAPSVPKLAAVADNSGDPPCLNRVMRQYCFHVDGFGSFKRWCLYPQPVNRYLAAPHAKLLQGLRCMAGHRNCCPPRSPAHGRRAGDIREAALCVSQVVPSTINSEVHDIGEGKWVYIVMFVTSQIHRSQDPVQAMRHSRRSNSVFTNGNRTCANEHEE